MVERPVPSAGYLRPNFFDANFFECTYCTSTPLSSIDFFRYSLSFLITDSILFFKLLLWSVSSFSLILVPFPSLTSLNIRSLSFFGRVSRTLCRRLTLSASVLSLIFGKPFSSSSITPVSPFLPPTIRIPFLL